MIFVDTSVWVAALRSGEGDEARYLQSLLDRDEVSLAAPVRVEILVGASRRDQPRLRRSLSALPVFYPNAATWTLIDEWVNTASFAGERFGFADLLIGVLAAQQESSVWSLDSDFGRMERIGLLELYRPS